MFKLQTINKALLIANLTIVLLCTIITEKGIFEISIEEETSGILDIISKYIICFWPALTWIITVIFSIVALKLDESEGKKLIINCSLVISCISMATGILYLNNPEWSDIFVNIQFVISVLLFIGIAMNKTK